MLVCYDFPFFFHSAKILKVSLYSNNCEDIFLLYRIVFIMSFCHRPCFMMLDNG